MNKFPYNPDIFKHLPVSFEMEGWKMTFHINGGNMNRQEYLNTYRAVLQTFNDRYGGMELTQGKFIASAETRKRLRKFAK